MVEATKTKITILQDTEYYLLFIGTLLLVFLTVSLYFSKEIYKKKYNVIDLHAPPTLSVSTLTGAMSVSNNAPIVLPNGLRSCNTRGQCTMNKKIGVKKCPEDIKGTLFYNPETEICVDKLRCVDPLKYAVNPDGSVNKDGICEPGLDICMCTSNVSCPDYVTTKFTITNGNLFSTLSSEKNFLINQVPFTNENVYQGNSTIDPLNEYCKLNSTYTEKITNGCSFTNSISDFLMDCDRESADANASVSPYSLTPYVIGGGVTDKGKQFCEIQGYDDSNWNNMTLCMSKDVCKEGNFTYNFDRYRKNSIFARSQPSLSGTSSNSVDTNTHFINSRRFCQSYASDLKSFREDLQFYTLSCINGTKCNRLAKPQDTSKFFVGENNEYDPTAIQSKFNLILTVATTTDGVATTTISPSSISNLSSSMLYKMLNSGDLIRINRNHYIVSINKPQDITSSGIPITLYNFKTNETPQTDTAIPTEVELNDFHPEFDGIFADPALGYNWRIRTKPGDNYNIDDEFTISITTPSPGFTKALQTSGLGDITFLGGEPYMVTAFDAQYYGSSGGSIFFSGVIVKAPLNTSNVQSSSGSYRIRRVHTGNDTGAITPNIVASYYPQYAFNGFGYNTKTLFSNNQGYKVSNVYNTGTELNGPSPLNNSYTPLYDILSNNTFYRGGLSYPDGYVMKNEVREQEILQELDEQISNKPEIYAIKKTTFNPSLYENIGFYSSVWNNQYGRTECIRCSPLLVASVNMAKVSGSDNVKSYQYDAVTIQYSGQDFRHYRRDFKHRKWKFTSTGTLLQDSTAKTLHLKTPNFNIQEGDYVLSNNSKSKDYDIRPLQNLGPIFNGCTCKIVMGDSDTTKDFIMHQKPNDVIGTDNSSVDVKWSNYEITQVILDNIGIDGYQVSCNRPGSYPNNCVVKSIDFAPTPNASAQGYIRVNLSHKNSGVVPAGSIYTFLSTGYTPNGVGKNIGTDNNFYEDYKSQHITATYWSDNNNFTFNDTNRQDFFFGNKYMVIFEDNGSLDPISNTQRHYHGGLQTFQVEVVAKNRVVSIDHTKKKITIDSEIALTKGDKVQFISPTRVLELENEPSIVMPSNATGGEAKISISEITDGRITSIKVDQPGTGYTNISPRVMFKHYDPYILNEH